MNDETVLQRWSHQREIIQNRRFDLDELELAAIWEREIFRVA